MPGAGECGGRRKCYHVAMEVCDFVIEVGAGLCVELATIEVVGVAADNAAGAVELLDNAVGCASVYELCG